MSTVRTNNILDASGGNTATINSMTPTADSLQGFRNRIINGAMMIDQRNAGASVSNGTGATAVFPVDRWSLYGSQATKCTGQQNAGSVTPPTGFVNYLGVTSSSAYSVLTGDYFIIYQRIEGFNTADLMWGTANAATVTLSFWVRSSLTGTFGGSLANNAFNRSYPFTYSISAANTWEQKTVTIAGDTSGTWVTNNTTGIGVYFALGAGSTQSGTAGAWTGSGLFSATGATSVVGTNGATFYITGVQLEVGSVATPFERRDYGRELIMCQRYFQKFGAGTGTYYPFGSGAWYSTTYAEININLKVTMRTSPTGNASAANTFSINGGVTVTPTSVNPVNRITADTANVSFSAASGGVLGYGMVVHANNVTTAFLEYSAEL